MTEVVRMDPYATASLDEKYRYVKALASAGDLLPRAFMGRPTPNPAGGMFPAQVEPGKILLMAETGAMLGVHPMAALQGIYIVDGKPTLSSNLLAALVRRAGHKLRVWVEGEGNTLTAIAQLIRSDDPDFTFTVRWSHADAVKAGLAGKDNWVKYERSMLKARAITEVIREGAPDVTLVAAYTPEELGANVNEEGEPIQFEATPQRPPRPAPESEPEPRAEAPIVDERVEETEFDWAAAVANLSSREEALALHAKARGEGKLDLEVKQGRKKVKLGALIVEVGKALAEAEKAVVEELVEAEIVDDDQPMAMGGE